jgi:hypothetical protein
VIFSTYYSKSLKVLRFVIYILFENYIFNFRVKCNCNLDFKDSVKSGENNYIDGENINYNIP